MRFFLMLSRKVLIESVTRAASSAARCLVVPGFRADTDNGKKSSVRSLQGLNPRYTIWMAAAGDFSARARTSMAMASSARLRAAPSETRTARGAA
jgi:hypothetical protein